MLYLNLVKPVDFRTSSYFSGPFRLAGAILLGFGVLLVFVNFYIGFGLLLAGVIALTTHYRLAIDFTRQTYHDYVWILGIRSGDKGTFESIQYIFINKSKVSRTMASRAQQTTFVSDSYDAYLKFSERDKLHLASDDSKEHLVESMRVIAQQLNCELLDYTSGSGTRI